MNVIEKSELVYVLLDLIDPNPYQARENEDPEHVEKVAASIAKDTLLQIPIARATGVGDRVQLAFGHTRLAASRRCTGNRGEDGG